MAERHPAYVPGARSPSTLSTHWAELPLDLDALSRQIQSREDARAKPFCEQGYLVHTETSRARGFYIQNQPLPILNRNEAVVTAAVPLPLPTALMSTTRIGEPHYDVYGQLIPPRDHFAGRTATAPSDIPLAQDGLFSPPPTQRCMKYGCDASIVNPFLIGPLCEKCRKEFSTSSPNTSPKKLDTGAAVPRPLPLPSVLRRPNANGSTGSRTIKHPSSLGFPMVGLQNSIHQAQGAFFLSVQNFKRDVAIAQRKTNFIPRKGNTTDYSRSTSHPAKAIRRHPKYTPISLPSVAFPKSPQSGLILPKKVVQAEPNVIRSCSNEGCTNILPPDTRAQRCVDCLMRQWKNANVAKPNVMKSTALACLTKGPRKSVTWTSDVEDPPSEDSDVSMIEKDSEGSEDASIPANDSDSSELSSFPSSRSPSPIHDQPQKVLTGLKIRLPLAAIRAALATTPCATPTCQEHLPAGYQWKSCVACRAKARADQRSSLKQTSMHTRMGSVEAEESSRIENRLSTNLVPGARLCAGQGCAHILPPVSEYNLRWCRLCNKFSRKNSRETKGSGTDFRKARALIPEGKKRCSSRDCGFLLSINALTSACLQCCRRSQGVPERLATLAPPNAMDPSGIAAPCPVYQSREILCAQLWRNLSAFYETQVSHVWSAPASAKFHFFGEYSTIALDYDIVGKQDEAIRVIISARKELERVCSLSFNAKSIATINRDAFTMHFVAPDVRAPPGRACVLPLPLPLPPLPSANRSLSSSSGSGSSPYVNRPAHPPGLQTAHQPPLLHSPLAQLSPRPASASLTPLLLPHIARKKPLALPTPGPPIGSPLPLARPRSPQSLGLEKRSPRPTPSEMIQKQPPRPLPLPKVPSPQVSFFLPEKKTSANASDVPPPVLDAGTREVSTPAPVAASTPTPTPTPTPISSPLSSLSESSSESATNSSPVTPPRTLCLPRQKNAQWASTPVTVAESGPLPPFAAAAAATIPPPPPLPPASASPHPLRAKSLLFSPPTHVPTHPSEPAETSADSKSGEATTGPPTNRHSYPLGPGPPVLLLPPPPPPPLPPLGLKLKGELEITLIPDHSHRYFPGRRHIFRFFLST